MGNIVKLARNKVSSNVVEKCFEVSTVGDAADDLREERRSLYAIVLGGENDRSSPLWQMANDKFGNYTVQCLIKHSRGDERENLRKRITAMEPDLRSQTGKYIVNCLKKLDEE